MTYILKLSQGVPTMTQWVKNSTAAAQVLWRRRFNLPSLCSGLEDLAVLQLWRGSDSIPGPKTPLGHSCRHLKKIYIIQINTLQPEINAIKEKFDQSL